MTLRFSHCVFIEGDENRIEKPGIVTLTNTTLTVDDFVFLHDGNAAASGMEMVAKWAIKRIESIEA